MQIVTSGVLFVCVQLCEFLWPVHDGFVCTSSRNKKKRKPVLLGPFNKLHQKWQTWNFYNNNYREPVMQQSLVHEHKEGGVQLDAKS